MTMTEIKGWGRQWNEGGKCQAYTSSLYPGSQMMIVDI